MQPLGPPDPAPEDAPDDASSAAADGVSDGVSDGGADAPPSPRAPRGTAAGVIGATRPSDAEPLSIAVALYLDEATEARVLEVRHALYDAGVVPTEDLEEARPHLTLAVCPDADVEAVGDRMEAAARSRPPFDIRLTALAAFPGEANILFLAPAPSRDLIGLHAGLAERLEAGAVPIAPLYRVGVWTPHLTVEKEFSRLQLFEAFRVARRAFRPVEGRAVEMGVTVLPPLRSVRRHALGRE